ncbi:MAG: tetratricopeptide repeat protein [Bryobacteraceae bacterium]|nr:tetratricopeptide repeat protein [Bryobacteraceae bacterium]
MRKRLRILAILATSTASLAAQAHPALARIRDLLQAGQTAAARTELETLRQSGPPDPRVLNLLGAVNAMERRFADAERSFRQAAQIAPQFIDPWLNLGRLYLEQADDRQALASFNTALRLDPANAEALFQSASIDVRTGAYRQAALLIDRLPPAIRTRPHAQAIACAAHAGLGNPAQATAIARRIAAAPDLAEADIDPVIPVLWKLRATEPAYILLDALHRRSLASAASRRRLALLEEEKGEYARARAVLEQIQPVTPDLLVELARLAYRGRDAKAALGYLAHARDQDEKNATIHYLFGMICASERLAVEAEKSLRRALELGYRDPMARYALGSVLAATGRAAEAVDEFRAFHAARPHEPAAALALGVALWSSGDSAAAKPHLAAASRQSGTAAPAEYFLGRLAQAEGNFEEAATRYDQTTKLNPAHADAWADLALIHAREQRYSEAAAALNRCLALDPDHLAGNLNLYVLYQRTGDPRAPAQRDRAEQLRTRRSAELESFWRTIRISPWETSEIAR